MAETMTIDLPEEVRREVERLARERGVSPGEFAAGATAEKVGAIQSAAAYFADRAKRAKAGRLREFLNRDGGEPPGPGGEAE